MKDDSGRIKGVKHAYDSKTCPSSFPTVKTKYYKNQTVKAPTPQIGPISTESLIEYIEKTPSLSSEIGNRHDDVAIKEAGDGNLKFVYIVVAACASFIVVAACASFII
ncbi:methylthioribose kinase-like [Gossypium australe]|uniref:Methylthioribose kinase-like n=1 Tax=Gossypium australe TaxID=47621 RepID=A0A5B6X345_9ROSI|nr:methylthioribose kinase-like [Gossypium australe]